MRAQATATAQTVEMARSPRLHAPDPDIAASAMLIGDTGRSAMLFALLDGGELPAAELAFRSGASPQAASAHLAKLVAGNLLVARRSGRQRLFRLASPEVGVALEALAAIAQPATIVALDQNLTMQRMHVARSCYDHLAGRLGVAVTDALVARRAIAGAAGAFAVTPAGARLFRSLGIDLDALRARRRPFARVCLDWTERRPHLAGGLGAALLERFLDEGWVKRNARDRALDVTPGGLAALRRRLHVEL